MNNYMPTGQPMFGQNMYNQMQNTMTSVTPRFQVNPTINSNYSNGIIWVQGIEGAKAYQMAPNSNALLMDSDTEGTMYIKVCDSAGMCNLRIFRYEEVTNTPNTEQSQLDMSQYVTRNELDEILANINVKSGGKRNGKQSVSTNESKPTITE